MSQSILVVLLFWASSAPHTPSSEGRLRGPPRPPSRWPGRRGYGGFSELNPLWRGYAGLSVLRPVRRTACGLAADNIPRWQLPRGPADQLFVRLQRSAGQKAASLGRQLARPLGNQACARRSIDGGSAAGIGRPCACASWGLAPPPQTAATCTAAGPS